MKIKQAELIELLDLAISRKQSSHDSMQYDTNPQIKLMTQFLAGEIIALQDVRDAIKGNVVGLKILAGK